MYEYSICTVLTSLFLLLITYNAVHSIRTYKLARKQNRFLQIGIIVSNSLGEGKAVINN